MKILAIRVKNLASLEGLTEIDFTKEPLKSAGIFAITGPMGAGKSTLLDALCLALFSKTPRHLSAKESGIELQDVASSKIGQGDVKGILRKGCGEGFAEVEFVGVDGNRYRSTWYVKRARNKIDTSLQPDTISLVNLTTDIPYPEKRKTEVLKEIERLVGLNFEQFTRSVLLAQGEFTAFLKAEKDQKSSLLEKLTGTDIYSEISRLIYEKFRLAEQEYKDLRRQMEGIMLLSPLEIQQLEDLQSAIANQLNRLNTESQSLLAELHWHESLAALTNAKNEAETIFGLAKQEKQNALERITVFSNVEAVQGARGMFDERTTLINSLQQKVTEQQVLLKKIAELESKIDIELQKLSEAESLLSKLETESVDAQPMIENAKVLDTLISEKTEQVLLAAKESATALQKSEGHAGLIRIKKAALESNTLQFEVLTKWKTENEPRKPIAENLQLIISKLADAGSLLLQDKNAAIAIKATNKSLEETIEKIKLLDDAIVQKEKKWSELNTGYITANDQLSAIPIDAIKAGEKLINASIEEILPARSCWELLYSNQQEYELTFSKLEKCKEDILSQTENLKLLNADLEKAQIRKEHSQKILARAQLQIAENVEEMRSQLVVGDPCPVCGSIHHPFSSNDPSLHPVLEGLKKEFEECSEIYNQLLKKYGSIEKSGEALANDRVGFEKELAIRSGKIKELTQNWQAFKMIEACLILPAAERLAWLDNQLIVNRGSLKEIQNKLNAYELLKQSIAQQKNDIYLQEKELSVIKESRKDAERIQQNLVAEIKRFTEESTACKTKIDHITRELNPYFTNPDWCSKWQQDPVLFEQKIKAFSKEWHEKNQAVELYAHKVGIVNAELLGLQNQMEAFEVVVTNAEVKSSGLQDSLSLLKTQRKQLFNGEEIGLVEQRFKSKIEDAQKSAKIYKTEKENTEISLVKSNINKDQNIITIDAYEKNVAGINGQISKWIDNYNLENRSGLDEEAIVSLLAYTTTWIAGERKLLQQVDDAITHAKARLEERVLQLSTHLQKKTSDLLPDNLLERQREIKRLTDAAGTEKNETDFKLRQDAANRQLAGDIEKAMQLKLGVYENWQKLNELLGSADGKKFRQIAQEYTLDILLGFTNIQLQELAGRYKLSRVPNSLALQVLDHDMGDEIRSVHSLSGGESFLVSLALALGLASLSSNRMKVESLFIDEGFGSLDQATLVIAMNALEKLQNQGRKVGVISHVQEMTERITTQIRISKISNGRSRVEVTGLPL